MGASVLLLCLISERLPAQPTNEASPQATFEASPDTNAQQLVQAILQLEERLRANQASFEQNNLELRTAAIRSAEGLSNGLRTIEKALAAQQDAFALRSTQELGAIRAANRALLTVGGAFAAIAALAVFMAAYFQWRMSRVWTALSAEWQALAAAGRTAAVSAGPGDVHLMGTGSAEAANAPLLQAIGQLEKRVQELEDGSRATLAPHDGNFVPGGNGDPPPTGNGEKSGAPEPTAALDESRIQELLRQGQGLLKEGKLEPALSCFDEVLSLDPKQTEALVRKGAALERLHKVNEAFECYDRAISADGSMTMAYLYKGGLCSRLERFKEALECYEKALRTHEEKHG